jgi:multiple sugar transport system substrate-binding protein
MEKKISRRKFLAGAGMVGAGMIAVACAPKAAPTEAPAPTAVPPTAAPAATAVPATAVPEVKPAKEGLAPGMIGGPTGFEGCERYQYGPDSPAGRAQLALQALPPDKKPQKLIMMLPTGATGHWDVPFPTDTSPTPKQLFEEMTGITLDIVGVDADTQTTKIIQDTTTKAGGYDLYSHWLPDKGTLAESGALFVLDDLVNQYKPEWEKYYTGGQYTVLQENYHAGKIVTVDFDGDYQSWVYRTDLFEDPNEQKAFKDKYGWDLQWPETWEQFDQIAEFFNRPDQNLWGATDLRNPVWSQVNFNQRFACCADPNQMLFDPDTAKPLIDGDAGVETVQWLVDSLKWHSPDALSWGWPEQYNNWAAGGAAMSCCYPNVTKFQDNVNNKDSVVTGKMKTGLVPGKVINGKLIRRGNWWPNIAQAVSSQTKYPEASYLTLQWGNSPSLFTWMVGNPAGYYDPFQTSDWTDPIVVGSYHQYQVDNLQNTIKHSVPCINMSGNNDYVIALDNEIQAVITKKKTAAEAVKAAAAEWEKITERIGRDKQIAALKFQVDAWPTVTDTPTIKSS